MSGHVIHNFRKLGMGVQTMGLIEPRVQLAMLGPVGPSQLACFRSWRRSGVTTHFLDTESRPLPRWLRGIVDYYHHIGPVRGLDGPALETISTALLSAGTSNICCLGEQLAVRLWQEQANLPVGTRVLTNPATTMQRLESKLEQIELGRQAGFDVLPSELVSSANVEGLVPLLCFPLALRPDRASVDGSFKAEYIEDPQALRRFIAARSPQAPAVVAQPFVTGPSLVVHGSRSMQGRPGELHAYIGRLKYHGVTVCLEPFALPSRIAAACNRFAALLDLRGIFHFDLMLDPKSQAIWFLEVNARFGGTTAKVFASGYDEPRAMLLAFGLISGGTGDDRRGTERPVVNRMAAMRCLLNGLKGRSSRIDYPYPSRSSLLATSLRAALCYRDEVLSARSPMSTLAFLSQYLPDR